MYKLLYYSLLSQVTLILDTYVIVLWLGDDDKFYDTLHARDIKRTSLLESKGGQCQAVLVTVCVRPNA